MTWDKRKSQPAKGDFWACCPFHQERSPSFHVDDRRGFYHCFGCGVSGDHIPLRHRDRGRDLPEAVSASPAWRACRCRPAMPRASAARRSGGRWATWWNSPPSSSRRSIAGAPARTHAPTPRARALSPETQKTFRIGFAPAERDAQKRHLAAAGIDEAMMIEAGLVIRPDDGRPAYDRFRNRLMIPIHDLRGPGRRLRRPGAHGGSGAEISELAGRAAVFQAHPAVQRPPRPPSRPVPRLDRRRRRLSRRHRRLSGWHPQRGRDPLGTAFTEDQIESLWRLAPEPVICFDGDRAGIAARRTGRSTASCRR